MPTRSTHDTSHLVYGMLPVPRQAKFSYAYNNNNNNNNNNLLKPHFELTPEMYIYGTVAY